MKKQYKDLNLKAFLTLLREVGEQILYNIIEKLDKFVFPTLRRE